MEHADRIEITFKSGETISYGKGEWDDYAYDGKAVIVKQKAFSMDRLLLPRMITGSYNVLGVSDRVGLYPHFARTHVSGFFM
jgi:hypothetical protein